MHLFILQRLNGKELNKVFKQVLGWLIAAIFFFPIYFWITVSIKKDKDIFALPPKLFDFEVSFSAYEEVFGISRFLYVEDMGAVRPGGGDFYMMPNLVDSIIIALGSTGLAMLISILAAYSLSRIPIRGQQHFMGWILSTRMMPPVAVAIPISAKRIFSLMSVVQWILSFVA